MEEIDKTFENLLKKPKKFYKPEKNNLVEETKELAKKTYDFAKSEEIKLIKSNALPELIIKNFDLEQIFQQIELQNDPLFTRQVTNISRLIPKKQDLFFKNLTNSTLKKEQSRNSNQNQPNENLEYHAEEESLPSEIDEEEEIGEPELSDHVNEEELEINDEYYSDNKSDNEEENVRQQSSKLTKTSIVDDEFFKLDEMERFLISEEKKLEDPDSGNDSEDDEENEGEDDIDLFKEESDDENDPAKTARFKDFFRANEEETKKTKRNKFLEGLEDVEDDKEDFIIDEPKSSFELRQERLKKKIDEMEEDAVQEKPWQLKGEISADSRPQNSLLEEVVEFDMTTRPAPIVTEQTTFQLEDIIKQRIKDKVFDSVERKAKPVDTPLEYKKKLVLDQEKSKESLAQIYEKEFLQAKEAINPDHAEKSEEVPKLHQDINTMMTNLFQKLDALSNFHFTPKPAAPELRIVSNLPAIEMEEIAPVAASEATLLAPQEIKRPTIEIMGKSERTSTDKKRERRKKKSKQKLHAKKRQEAQSKNPLKFSKSKVKDKGKKKQESGLPAPKSSKAFFSQLEDQVKSQILSKMATKRKDQSKNSLNAKKLKL